MSAASPVRTDVSNRYVQPMLGVPAERLPLDPVVVYTRKSTEDANMQARSHDQQLEAIHDQYPKESISKYFSDDKSGKTFGDRLGFQTMRAWCEAHPQPHSRPGKIVMFDKSRFGRALIPGTSETDWIAYDEARLAFAKVGWELVFIKNQKTGNAVVDRIVDTLDDEQSSEYIRRLRINVMRGQEDSIKQGYWCRGMAPFPSCRIEARTGRVLMDALRDESGKVIRDGRKAVQPAERAQPGARVILGPDSKKVAQWVYGANMLLEGHSWRDLLKYFNDNVPTPQGRSRWSRKGLKLVYTNEALIGILERTVGGVLQRIKAQWEPIVDVDLFHRVVSEIYRREDGYRITNRRDESQYILRNVTCIYCGAKYTGALRSRKDGSRNSRRYYVHQEIREMRVTPEQEALARKHGCRNYAIPADFLEQKVRNLILQQRGSSNWSETMAKLLRESMGYRDTALLVVEECRTNLNQAQTDLHNLVTALTKAQGRVQDLILEQIDKQQELVDRLTADLAAASSRVARSGEVEMGMLNTLKETQQVMEGWSTQNPNVRQRIVDWWVVGITVTPEQVPAKTKPSTVVDKKCQVWLRTTPTPLEIVVPGVIRNALPKDSTEPKDGTESGDSTDDSSTDESSSDQDTKPKIGSSGLSSVPLRVISNQKNLHNAPEAQNLGAGISSPATAASGRSQIHLLLIVPFPARHSSR